MILGLFMLPALWLASPADGPSLDYAFFKERVQPIFLEKRPGHARCVTCHSHGAPPLQPLAAGADSALCIDGSAPALELARGGAAAMGAADRLETQQSDAFDAAAAGWLGFKAGKRLVIPGVRNQSVVTLAKLLPQSVVLRLAGLLQRTR